MFLLSKESLARLCYIGRLHKYIDYTSEEQKEKILKFIEDFQVNELAKNLWFKSSIMSPKVLSDVFEAYIGALFFEGGIDLVRKVLDPIIISFIVFYLKFYPKIMLDIKKYVLDYFTQQDYKVAIVETEDLLILRVVDYNLIEKEKDSNIDMKIQEKNLCLEFLKNSN